MTDLVVRDSSELEGLFQRGDVERLTLQSLNLPSIPAALGGMTRLSQLSFDNCEIGEIDARAFEAGKDSGPLEVTFMYSTFDDDALFERVLVHGQGNWRIKVFSSVDDGYRQDPRWKLVAQLGDDGIGDEKYRRQSFELLCGRELGLPKEPGPDELRLLDHAKKNIRELALGYLESRLADPLAGGIPAGTKVLLAGKPVYHDNAALKDALAARDVAIVKKLADATHVLLMAQPGDKLAAAVQSKLPIVLEAHMKAALAKDAPKPPAASPKEANSLEQLLLSVDEDNQLLALEMVKARALDDAILPVLVATILFSESAAVRKRGRELVMSHGSTAMVSFFQGDKRNYTAITDGKKLAKLAEEFRGAFFLDPAAFTLALVKIFARREHKWGGAVEPALIAALAYPENEPKAFAELADYPEIYLPPPKKALPKGMSALRGMKHLRIPYGRIKSADNLAELVSLPQTISLDLWVKGVDLPLLAPLAKIVHALEFRGAVSELTDVGPLRAWNKLVRLDLSNTGVTDLSPLAELGLTALNVADTKVESVAPLARIRSLRWLNVQRVPAKDVASLGALEDLEEIDVSFTSQTDLSPFAALGKLRRIRLWGVKVQSLAPLAKLPLEAITLNYTKVPDLSPLLDVPTLAQLDLVGAEVDKAQVAALQKKLPNLYVSQ